MIAPEIYSYDGDGNEMFDILFYEILLYAQAGLAKLIGLAGETNVQVSVFQATYEYMSFIYLFLLLL